MITIERLSYFYSKLILSEEFLSSKIFIVYFTFEFKLFTKDTRTSEVTWFSTQIEHFT